MKKFIAVILVGVLIVLSGCMSDEVDHEPHEISLYDNLIYSYDSISFNDTSESDIIYSTNNQYLDYLYVYDILITEPLTADEMAAYSNLFITIGTIIENNSILMDDILSYTSSEFNEAAEGVQIVLGLEDIVMFNTLKIKITELEELSGSTRIRITKIEYIEYILDRELTSDEVDSLEYLQVKYSDLYNNTHDLFDMSENTFDNLLETFSIELSYIPLEGELIDLEIAYDIIQQVIND